MANAKKYRTEEKRNENISSNHENISKPGRDLGKCNNFFIIALNV